MTSTALLVEKQADWSWHSHCGVSWLTCSLLADWPHAFGSRHGFPRKPDQLAGYLNLPSDQAHWAHQVHGHHLVWTESGCVQTHAPVRDQADAVATQTPSQSVWVSTADCSPILIAGWQLQEDALIPQVGAVHAGWRGTAASIVPQVVQAWLQKGVQLESIKVAMGPAISGPVYQVSQEVAAQVLQTLPPDSDLLRQTTYPDPEPDRIRLDIRKVNELQLLQLGIPAENISVSPHCTWTESELFFSYRRDRSLRHSEGHVQVQWSGIGLDPSRLWTTH